MAVRRDSRPILRFAAFIAVAMLVVGCGGTDKSDKSDGSSTTATLSEAGKRLQTGLAAQGAGQLDKAREEYLAVLKQEPSNKLAHYDLGVIYQQLNDVKGAADSYRRALAIDPNYQPALFNLGVLLTASEPQAAASYYRQILALNPKDANVHLNLGLLLRQTGQDAEGNAEVGKAVELNPALASRLPTATTVAPPTTAKK